MRNGKRAYKLPFKDNRCHRNAADIHIGLLFKKSCPPPEENLLTSKQDRRIKMRCPDYKKEEISKVTNAFNSFLSGFFLL